MTYQKKNYDPERLAALRALPREIKERLTPEEADAFLLKQDLPDSLKEKLKDYLKDA
jgi:hypothetical protein